MYVGLPGLKQREEIFSIHLRKRGWDPTELKIDISLLARKTPNRTGSEIEQIVIEGLIRKGKEVGFGRDHLITTCHLLEAINDVKIMAELNPGEASGLLEWAKSHKVMMANKEGGETSGDSSQGVGALSKTGKPETNRKISLDESEI